MNKNLWKVLGGILVVVALVFLFNSYRQSFNEEDSHGNLHDSLNREEVGLNGKRNLGNLTFELTRVELSETLQKYWNWNESLGNYETYTLPTGDHSFYWVFKVSNNRDRFANVSDCGMLLFEDKSQYSSSQFSFSNVQECEYYIIAPGAEIAIITSFYFSSSSKSWDKIVGNKITYFSSQNDEIVKFTVHKKDMSYSNYTIW